MNRPLRNLPRVNYNWQVQAKLSESDKKNLKKGKPQKRGANDKEMGDEDEFQSPMNKESDSNTSMLTIADEADFTDLSEINLKRKVKNRSAKLNIYQRKFLGENTITMGSVELTKYLDKIKDQMEYLDKLVTHCEEVGYEEARAEADELITDFQDVVDILDKELSKELSTEDEHVTGITPINKNSGESGIVTADNLTSSNKITKIGTKNVANVMDTSTPMYVKTVSTNKAKGQVSMLEKRVEMLITIIDAVRKKHLDISEDRLRSVKATDLPKIEQAKDELSKLFDNHVDKCDYEVICNKMLEYIAKAVNWIQHCHDAIQEARLDITDDSRNNIEPIKLDRFQGWRSDIDIYMFMEDFGRHLSSART